MIFREAFHALNMPLPCKKGNMYTRIDFISNKPL